MDAITLPLETLIPYARNPRRNERAIAPVVASLKEFGWRQPIVVDEGMMIIAGHTRLEAARQLGLTEVPVHVARGLTPAQARAYRLLDNRSSENSERDEPLFGLELDDLQLEGFDLPLTTSSTGCSGVRRPPGARDIEDDIPDAPENPVSGPGDLRCSATIDALADANCKQMPRRGTGTTGGGADQNPGAIKVETGWALSYYTREIGKGVSCGFRPHRLKESQRTRGVVGRPAEGCPRSSRPTAESSGPFLLRIVRHERPCETRT